MSESSADGSVRQPLSRGIIALHKRFYGRGATTGRTFISPDRLLEIFALEPQDQTDERTEREGREDRGELERPVGGLSEP